MPNHRDCLRFVGIVVVLVLSGVLLLGQTRTPPPSGLSGQSTPPSVGTPTVTPTAIGYGVPTTIFVTILITDNRLLPTSVVLNRVDADGNLTATLGSLRDDGTNGDVAAGDQVFSGTFTVSEPAASSINLRVSAAFRGLLQRFQTSVFSVNVESGISVLNSSGDFWGINLGPSGVGFNFADVPEGTARLRVSRSSSLSGPWTTAVDVAFDDNLLQPLLDPIDGTISDYYYRMEALDGNGSVLKTYAPVFIPKFHKEAGSASEGFAAQASTPIYDTEWITDAIYQDSGAMTMFQIRDVLEQHNSYLSTTTVDDTVVDTDGVSFSPAKTIASLAQQYGINPQLILVSLQKESGLTTCCGKGKNLPKEPKDSWMGAKLGSDCPSGSRTIRGQLDCGTNRLRAYLTELDTTGHTRSGWQVGVAKTSVDNLSVKPFNRAVAALFTYTPYVGSNWGGQFGGVSLNYAVWTPTLFGNIVHILKWQNCGSCPQPPEVNNQGWKTAMGVEGRPESGQQMSSRHGVSAALPPSSSYTMTFTCDLKTWDSYNQNNGNGSTGYWDSFSVSITSSRYWLLSLSDPITFASYLFGGGSYGDHILKQSGAITKTMMAPANSGAVTYVNIMLDTATFPEADTNFPSWGTCTMKKVIPSSALGIISAPQ
jgi:hypothetical protein